MALGALALPLVWKVALEDNDGVSLRALLAGVPEVTELLREGKNSGVCEPRRLDGVGGEPVRGVRSRKVYGVCRVEGDSWRWSPTELGVAEATGDAADGGVEGLDIIVLFRGNRGVVGPS